MISNRATHSCWASHTRLHGPAGYSTLLGTLSCSTRTSTRLLQLKQLLLIILGYIFLCACNRYLRILPQVRIGRVVKAHLSGSVALVQDVEQPLQQRDCGLQ